MLDAEYNAFFNENPIENDSEGIGNQLYQIQAFNNVPTSTGFFGTYRRRCELCDKEHKDNCEFAEGNDKIKLREIIAKLEDRDLVLCV